MTVAEFVEKNKVTITYNRIDEGEISQYEAKLGVKMGPQLKAYILNYGILTYEYIRFFNINSIQGEKSDMVNETLFLHEHYPQTKGLVAFEDQGDGDYYLVDSEDKVYRFIYSFNELVDTGMTLDEYIIDRFESVEV